MLIVELQVILVKILKMEVILLMIKNL